MGFLAPLFLAAFAALAAPLYLHLLRRQTTQPQPFSSLMFFEARTQSSMRHRRLRYLWLLTLRLALLALLVLAFANPFLLRPAATAANQRHLLVLDDSFSMQAGSRLADAQRAALSQLASLHGRAQVAILNDRLTVLTRPSADSAALAAAVRAIRPGFSHADFGMLARGLRALAAESSTPLTVHLYSDMQASNLPANFADLVLPPNVTLDLHAIGAEAPNWTVASVAAPDRVWGSPRETKPERITATIAGFHTPAASRTVGLFLDRRQVATQTVAIPPSGRATAVFDGVVIPYGWTRGEVRLLPGGDGFAADDAAYFTVQRTDPERVLFVHSAGDSRSPLYFATALTAGTAAFTVEDASAGALVDRNPDAYALVVLSDVPSLPPAFSAALTRYVNGGGGVLIATGTAAQNAPFFTLQGSRNFANQPATTAFPGWQATRFFFATTVAPGDARVLATLNDQSPLLLERTVGLGRVVLFASGFDNLTNDLPMNPSFVPFIRETAHRLADRAQTSPILQLLAPDGARLPPATPPTDQGFYQLTLANHTQRLLAVNPDRRESDLAVIPPDTLALWRGSRPAAPASNPAPAAPARVPVSLWWYIMLLLLVAAVVESIVASRYLAVRRDDPAEVTS